MPRWFEPFRRPLFFRLQTVFVIALALVVTAACSGWRWPTMTAVVYLLVYFSHWCVNALRQIDRKIAVQRWHRNLCVKCGYDLRGTASAVCPECGSKVPPPSPPGKAPAPRSEPVAPRDHSPRAL